MSLRIRLAATAAFSLLAIASHLACGSEPEPSAPNDAGVVDGAGLDSPATPSPGDAGSDAVDGPVEGGRSFFMGSTPFFATPTAFPAFRFDYLVDVDLVSLHLDDFWGVPWTQFESGAALPTAWTSQWTELAQAAAVTGKPIYLSVSPLGDRTTLARAVTESGTTDHWAPADANGCYLFASDPDATKHRDAYVAYLEWVVERIKPAYLSPAIEVNILFSKCPAQKAAWIDWMSAVISSIKAKHPALVVFPTVQLEHVYGIADAVAACPSITPQACFAERLPAIAALPGDRLAFSVYPAGWGYLGQTLPSDTFSKVQAATNRPIWIAETGWPAVPIRSTYGTTPAECGSDLVPASIASTEKVDAWASWLLAEADARRFEAVVWWESRDHLDGNVAAACPCPGVNDTCALASTFRSVSPTAEILLRMFGNMGLVEYGGTPRAALATWNMYRARPRVP